MAESWRERQKRLAREMDAAVRALLAALPVDDAALRERLEALAPKPYFSEFTWLWGPAIARRNRVFFRPFMLSNFSSFSVNAKADWFDAWKGETAKALERWLDEVDAADDVELTRRLYSWRIQRRKHAQDIWREDSVERFSAAESPAARFTALAKIDTGWMTLDFESAEALYTIDPVGARSFILGHLPWFGWLGEKRRVWYGLLERSRETDPEFHFELYRRIIDEKHWRVDVLELGQTIADPALLDLELERRHPRSLLENVAEVFYELLRTRRRDAVPYVLRHVTSISPRWGIFAQHEVDGLSELVALADRQGWLNLWGAILRTGATKALFDSEVKRLIRSTALAPAEIRLRLSLIAGHGAEAHMPGVSWVRVLPLEEGTAIELYQRFPDVLRGPFRMHVAPGWHDAYPRLIQTAIDAGDTELVDFFAARAGIQPQTWGDRGGWKKTIETLTSHYESLPEREFVSRASNALSRMPAFAVWDYDLLLRSNRLARLLFERSTALYLTDGGAVRDLLESPQIQVQILAFRILGRDDPRACDLAAQNADLLQATLFRPLHRRTRLLAFRALENATRRDATTAKYLVGRMKEALALPEMRYPTEKLVGLIAKVLHAWPSLRFPSEVPTVYGEVPSHGEAGA